MIIKLPKEKIPDPVHFIRRCGYGQIRDRRTGQVSYVRRLRGSLYPRFHVYIVEKKSEIFFNLHLDQRQTRYEGVTAHSGDYDGPVVEGEEQRILASLKS